MSECARCAAQESRVELVVYVLMEITERKFHPQVFRNILEVGLARDFLNHAELLAEVRARLRR